MSSTYVGVIVLLLSTLLKHAGVELGDEQITAFVLTGGEVVGALVALYGRYRLGGVTIAGTRK